MREAIGGTWIFQIVVFFILLFTGFMCLSINQSKAFKVKSSMIDAIERHNGILLDDITSGDDALEEIVASLSERAYRTTGKCPNAFTHPVTGETIPYVGFDRDGHLNSTAPAFCIARITTHEYQPHEVNELPNMSYYRIVVFYQLDLPIFNDVFNFTLRGDTKVLSVSR